MICLCVMLAALGAAQDSGAVVVRADVPAVRDLELERRNLTQLVTVHRVYVDKLNGGETAAQMRDIIISALERSNLFAVTENPERADATLRGSAEDLVFTDTFASSEGVNAYSHVSASNGASNNSSGRKSGYFSAGAGEQDSLKMEARKHEATMSVRLVNKDGDVIWSTTQESLGAKFRGASADVANKVTRQLLSDYERAARIQAAHN